MLTSVRRKSLRAGNARFAIVASRYNARYVDAMLRAAKAELKRAGAKNVQVIRVPGAYEIPIVAARLARLSAESARSPLSTLLGASKRFASPTCRVGAQRRRESDEGGSEDGQAPRSPSAILCLGVILRGQTVHAAHIGDAVSRALMEIQLRYEVPVIHEVLLLENEEQARARCLSRNHNRGAEAAQTAIAMAKTMAGLSPDFDRSLGHRDM
jgi:6,7-dimethyl-8-ribityllumazine synthase